MAKQKTTKAADRFAPKKRPTPSEAEAAAAKITGEVLPQKKDGTPRKSNQGRKQATHGLTRTSILADKELMHQLKVKAVQENRHMYELHQEAIEAYLKANK